MYYVRTDGGAMIAKISNIVAERIIRTSKGEFITKNFKNGSKITFVIKEDCGFGTDDFMLMLWKGFYLVAKD